MKAVSNAQGCTEQMESMIADVLEKNRQFKYLIIAMEPTGFYGVHIANYLSACERLAVFSTCLLPQSQGGKGI